MHKDTKELDFKNFYNKYHRKHHDFFKVIDDNNFTYWYILKALHRLKPDIRNLKILDVGCGVGTLALYYWSKGAIKVDGIDISTRAIEIANRAKKTLEANRVSFKVGELAKVSTSRGKGQYDLVTCTEVLEHIPDDGLFLEQLLSQVAPGGRLLLSTPSRENWLTKSGWMIKHDQAVGHLRRYTQEGLQKLVESAIKKGGYKAKIVSLEAVEGPIRAMLFTSRLGFLIRFIRGPLIPAFHWFDDLLAKLAGRTDLVVGVEKK